MHWVGVVVGVLAVWAGLSVLAAIALGRAVRIADRHRPRSGATRVGRRSASSLERVVSLATGAIPVIHARAD